MREIMTDAVVPAAAKLAAKRAFVRTTAQAYGTSLAGGLTVAVVSDAFQQASAGNWVPLAISGIVTVFSPLIAGAAAYFTWLGKGIPADYVVAAEEKLQGE